MFKKSAAPSGYFLTKSLRFRSSASAYLNRTPSTSNGTIWTYSAWVKLGAISTASSLVNAYSSGTDFTNLAMNSDGSINFYTSVAGTGKINVKTAAVFCDPSAWYHLVVAYNGTSGSLAFNIYINGVNQSLTVTTAQSAAKSYICNNVANYISNNFNQSAAFDGYLAEVNMIDGQALTPSSFGSTNATTGVWQPAKYTGTYGTNGFYLKFTDITSTATLGTDYSGNSNTWTVNNISLTTGATYDSMTDVPTLTSATTANYCVLNPISSGGTITNGNLSTSNNDTTTYGTVAITTEKFYWEYTITACSGGAAIALGVSKDTSRSPAGVWGASDVFLYQSGGNKYGNGTSGAYGATYTTGDVIGVALDMTGYTLTFYKNNVSQGTAFSSTQISPYILIPMFYGYPSGNSTNVNFGQQPFTYTPPTGFVALNTFNLPTSTIVKGNTVMDATLYTGTLLSNAVTNTAGFKPDLVWIKSRSATTNNKLTDSVRGTTKALISNTAGAETTDTQGLTAFGTGGFTVGTDTDYNNITATYVGWQWQAGQGSTSSNTSGSITSTVSVNASAGFSVATYTGNGSSGATVGHSLGVTPSMIIIKNLGTSAAWAVNHTSIGATQYLNLNTTGAVATDTTVFQNRSSTTVTLGTDGWVNGNTNTYVAYCWTPIAGYSAFGSYTGNGSADGPFVYLGFRPKFILFKQSSSAGNDWYIFDSVRSTYNVATNRLFPNSSGAEQTNLNTLDILSNGWKFRDSNSAWNGSGDTYIYMAFAENPFKNALAR